MDFFQGSATPNFISFCLANQSEDELQASANSVPNLSATLTQVASHSSSSDPVLPLYYSFEKGFVLCPIIYSKASSWDFGKKKEKRIKEKKIKFKARLLS